MFNKIIVFLKEVQLEMKKVNWPTRGETIRYTLMVIAIALIVAIFLGGSDFIFSELRNCYLLKDAELCNIGRILGF